MADDRNPFADIDEGHAGRPGGGTSSGSGAPSGGPGRSSAGSGGRGRILAIVMVVLVVIVIAFTVVVPRLSSSSAMQTTTDSSSGSSSDLATTTSAAADAAAESDEDAISVTVTVDGTEGGHGSIYDGTVSVPAGSSVYDALNATGVEVVSSSSMGMGAYVSSIDGLAEKDQSQTSGWLFYVDGVKSSKSCDQYKLEDGQSVTWVWKLDALSES